MLPRVHLAWMTDPHLNFVPRGDVGMLAKYLLQERSFDALVITGDIAEAPTLEDLLTRFQEALGLPVYFVLGNHDFYMGSIEETERVAVGLQHDHLSWLTQGHIVRPLEGVALCGHDGWYDARLGLGHRSHVEMTDFHAILELSRFRDAAARADFCRQLAEKAAASAKSILTQACEGARRVIFATHVPPFEGACWHEGKLSDAHWLPWFSSPTMGEVLLEVARANPEVEVLVLCGHTHGAGTFRPAANLEVLTGAATYGNPQLSAVFDLASQTALSTTAQA